MILKPDVLKEIAKTAGDVQRAVYYQQTRHQPKPGDVGAMLERRQFYLIDSVIRELWALGWRPNTPLTETHGSGGASYVAPLKAFKRALKEHEMVAATRPAPKRKR